MAAAGEFDSRGAHLFHPRLPVGVKRAGHFGGTDRFVRATRGGKAQDQGFGVIHARGMAGLRRSGKHVEKATAADT